MASSSSAAAKTFDVIRLPCVEASRSPIATPPAPPLLSERRPPGGLPATGYAIGMILFSRFSLNQAEHAEVLAQLHERRGE